MPFFLASWKKVLRGRLDCFFFSLDSESLYASTREQHGVGWGSVAGLTENKTKPSSWGLAELDNNPLPINVFVFEHECITTLDSWMAGDTLSVGSSLNGNMMFNIFYL